MPHRSAPRTAHFNEEDYDNPLFLRTLSKAISLIEELRANGYDIGLTGEEPASEIASKLNEELLEAKKHIGIEQEDQSM